MVMLLCGNTTPISTNGVTPCVHIEEGMKRRIANRRIMTDMCIGYADLLVSEKMTIKTAMRRMVPGHPPLEYRAYIGKG